MKVLVFLEQRGGALKSSSLEALSTASVISGGDSSKVAAVVVGDGVDGLANEVKDYGCDLVYVASHAA